MNRTKSMFLALVAVLFTPMAANAVPIEITGFGVADGMWDVTTLLCDRRQPDCIDELVSQVWYQNSSLAQAFAVECHFCLGFPNQPGNPGQYTPFVNHEVTGNQFGALGWAYATGGANGILNDYTGGSHDQYWMVAERVSVPEPGTLALLGIGLFGMGLARRRKSV